MKKVVGTLAVGSLSLAIGVFTANAATKTHGFSEGKAEWKAHHPQRPPGWNQGENTGWGAHKTAPPGLRR
jgi:hypothetical protein